MKIITIVMLVLIASVSLTGCGAFYGSEKQYEKGDWYWITGSREAARIKEDKLSLEKLKMTPAKMAVIKDGKQIEYEIIPKGESPAEYKGIVTNFSRYDKINFIVRNRQGGIEVNSWLLGPGQSKDPEYMLPGQYVAYFYKGGREVSKPWPFTVGPRQFDFLGKMYHWYVYYEDY